MAAAKAAGARSPRAHVPARLRHALCRSPPDAGDSAGDERQHSRARARGGGGGGKRRCAPVQVLPKLLGRGTAGWRLAAQHDADERLQVVQGLERRPERRLDALIHARERGREDEVKELVHAHRQRPRIRRHPVFAGERRRNAGAHARAPRASRRFEVGRRPPTDVFQFYTENFGGENRAENPEKEQGFVAALLCMRGPNRPVVKRSKIMFSLSRCFLPYPRCFLFK